MDDNRRVAARLLALVRDQVDTRPVLTVFLLALFARTVVMIGVELFVDGAVFPSEGLNARLVVDLLAGEQDGWRPFAKAVYHQTSGFLLPATGAVWLFGLRLVVVRFLAVLAGAATAAITTRLACEVVERRWAAVAGIVVALHPSQVLWSSLFLKDAVVWLAAVIVALGVAVLLGPRPLDDRRGRWRGPAAAALVVLGTAWLGVLRPHAMVVAAIALVLTGLWHVRRSGWRVVAVPLVVAVIVPAVLGYGVLGSSLATDRATEIRTYRDRVTEGELAVDPATGDPSLGVIAVRGMSLVVLEPYPWQSTNSPLDVARVEAVGWYALLALAALGAAQVLGRSRALLFPLLYGVGVALVFAVGDGNLGTAYRHRSELVWVVALLAVVGGRALRKRSSSTESSVADG